MASRVNTKFVVILAGALFVLFAGVAGLAVYAQMRSGERLVRQGDAALAEGDFDTAAKKYARAVHSDQSRTDWLAKWRDALVKTTPPNTATYEKAYKEYYMGILTKLAALQPKDPQPQIDFVKEFDSYIRAVGGGTLSGFQQIESLVGERATQLDPDDPKTKELLAYRGRAIVDEMLRVNVNDDKVAQAKQDLTEALKVNPDDTSSALALVQWYYAKVDEARRDVRQAEVDEALKEFKSHLAALVQEHGSLPSVSLFAFRTKALDAQRKAVTPEERRKVRHELAPAAVATLDTLADADVSKLTTNVLNTAAQVLPPFLDADARQKYKSLLQRVVEARPDDPTALLLLGQSLAVQGEPSKAYDTFDTIAQLPDKPVSLEGMMLPAYRRLAVQNQVDMLLLQYQRTDDEKEKAQLLARAKERRDVLKAMTDVNSENDLKLRDAQIAFIEGDYAQSVLLLGEIRRNQTQGNPRVERLLAMALARQGNLGDAANLYERLATDGQMAPADFNFLGDIYLQMENPEKALLAYSQVLRRATKDDNDYQYAQHRIDAVKQATGQVKSGLLDPVVAALVQAQKLTAEGDTGGAIKVLSDALDKAPNDTRLIRELAARYVASDQRDEAITLVQGALKRKPDNENLKALQQQVTISDPVKAAEAIIDSLENLTPLQKAIQRFYLYQKSGMKDEADNAFAEAEKLDPDNAAVIEIGFLRALSQGDDAGLDEAAKYAARAAETNADRLGGLTFKGRLELARGNAREAEATLQRAVDRMQYDPMLWRWLGQAQRQNGKVDAALQSFQRAYQGRPSHVGIAEDYARELLVAGQGPKALDVARKAVTQPERSPRLVGFWLDLEAQYGDRSKAMESRRKIFESRPSTWTDADYLSNCIAYLNLLIEDKKFDEFETAMGVLEKDGSFSPLQIAGLRARALAEQGKVDDGRTLLTTFIESLPKDKMTVEAYMTLGRYERQYGTLDDAIAAYEKAVPFEDPARLEADRALGDLHFGAAQNLSLRSAGKDPVGETADQIQDHFQKAAKAYQRVHEATPADTAVSKRLAETLIRLDRYEEAKSVLASIGNDDDLQVLLLRSMIAIKGGDTRGAREFLNRAVELYPNDPVPFFQRASLNRSDEALFPDVIADLDQATKLRPGMIEAWTLRFSLYKSRNQMDEAFAQLRSAIKANPDTDALKRLLVRELVDAGRSAEARAEVQKIADANWDNVNWLHQAALISYQQRSFDEARKYYARLFELDPKPLAAADLLNAWFRADNKPTLPDVNRLLRKVHEIDLDKENPRTRVVTKMLMARAEHWLGEKDTADTLTLDAYKDAKNATPVETRIWFDDLIERFHTADSDGSKEAFAFLDTHADTLGTLPPILDILVIRNDLAHGTPLAQCDARVAALADKIGDDPYTMLEYCRLKNQLYYAMGRYKECAEACKAGLAVNLPGASSDLELNNNLAYVLAKHLKQPEQALPYAEAAAQAAPLNAAVLDTLGWVYFESGRYRDADRVLQRAITTAKGPDELVPAYLHLAQTKKATGDASEAKKYILMANRALPKATQTIKDQYAQDVKALFDELTSESAGN